MKRAISVVAFVAVLTTSIVVGLIVAKRQLAHLRSQLLHEVDIELVASADAVARLVDERAHSIRNDLHRACEVQERAARAEEPTAPVVRSHLMALNRWTRHYLRLWYFDEGEEELEVSGHRDPNDVVPDVAAEELAAIDAQARAQPGIIAGRQIAVPKDSPYDSLRLLAMATDEGATITVLVNMDEVFEALRSVERLPGVDLWVVDDDGSVLLEGDEERKAAVLDMVLTGPDSGMATLGPLPSLWPFSHQGQESHTVAWRKQATQPFAWVTAVAAPLSDVAGAVHERAAVVLLEGALLVVGLAGLLVFVLWLVSRELQMRERLRTMAMVEELREQLLRLERLSTVGYIAAGLAHEMGTPLGVIAIRIDQLLEQVSDDKQKSALKVMREQIERINRLIRQLLDSARPSTSKRIEVSVREAASQVAALMAHRFEAKRVALENMTPSAARIFADPDQLQQVLLNLLVNACDACRPGDRVCIEVRSRPDEQGRLGVAVADNGPGVDPRVLPEVFEPFVTTKEGGTGLGLAIVSDILRRHQGDVTLETSEHGTAVVTWWRLEGDAARLIPAAPQAEVP